MFFSILTGLLFLIGLAAHAGLTSRFVLTQRSLGIEIRRTTLYWNTLYGAVLLFLTVWGFIGFIDGGILAFIAGLFVSPGIVALSHIIRHRERVFDHLKALEPRLRHRAEWGILLLFCFMGMLMIEAPWSHAVLLFGPSYWWLEMALIMLATLFFYLVGHHHGSATLPVAFFCSFVGLAQYFIRRFKNAAILPNDLLALGTAAAVRGQYTYTFDGRALLGIFISLAGFCVVAMLHPTWVVQPDDASRSHRGLDAARGVASAALCAALVLVPNYMEVFQVQIMYWYSINYYEKQGFLPTFIAVWQDMPIREPEDYTPEEGERITSELASSYENGRGASEARLAAVEQFEEDNPTVIVVMNESFSDLSIFDGLRSGYEGPQFFKSLPDALWRGKLFVNVHGGGTCNTEFEFLTGNSLGYIGAGKYPYSTFKFDNIDSMAHQFKQLGYSTCAIHPNYPSNWNRNTVYPTLGFDSFLSIDDFGGFPEYNIDGTRQTTTPTGVPVFHSGVSDQGTFQRILELLEQDDKPQFIFDVTMQNHGSYNQNNIPADKLTHYVPTGTYEDPAFLETPERLNEYLSCVEESDRALEWFVDELRKIDRHVVLVFFGDHQPSMTPDYNDAWYRGEDELTHSQRIYHADYLVWANYDIAGQDQKSDTLDTSVDVLGTITRDAIGAPLSTYEEAQMAVNEGVKAINLHGYLGADGNWYQPEAESPYAELYRQMSYVEYHNFGERL